ncbi:MAG: threonine/serine exporter family protein [Clostridia bacterium]|nr:threonine/serine exporter family protein [Clostridia bacterium]
MTDTEKISIITNNTGSDSIADNVLRIALDIGEGLLRSGAEIHRVELAIERISKAYGASHVEVFSIHSLIIASVRMADGGYSSQTRRITNLSNHLMCLERYNNLSREICASPISFEEVDEKIREIKKKSKYPFALTLLGNTLAASGFAVLFGGSLRDAGAAAIIAVIISFISLIKTRYFNDTTKTLFLSFISGILTCLSVIVGLAENMDMVAIGTIMLLIPGLWLGNATRDLLYGDTLAGTVKTVHACITAIMIAIGYAISFFLLGEYCPAYTGSAPFGEIGTLIAGIISSLVGTVGFAFMFKLTPSKLWITGICGVATYVLYELTLRLGANELIAAFTASAFLALFSEICARRLRTPTNIFLFTGCIPIVPGGALYYTMYHLLSLNIDKALDYFKLTGQILLGMALGLSLASVGFGLTLEAIDFIKKKRVK